MNTKLSKAVTGLLIGIVFLTSCDTFQSPDTEVEPTAIPQVISDGTIVAEGRIVPREDVQLSFFTNGQVEEILVEEGDLVKAGDIVARLGDREQLEAAIANAEAELLASQQALDVIYETADLAKAEAFRAISGAETALKEAQYQLDNFTIPQEQEGLTAVEAVEKMKKLLDGARDAFEPYKYKSSGDSTRKDLKDDLDAAQSDYNSAVKRLNYETAVEQAKAQLEKAKDDYEEVKDGPDPDAVDAAQARINAAEANLKAAESALDNLDLEATINGTIVEQNLIISQQAVAGVPVMLLADFSQMYAETDDLTELDVVDISVGQKVTIVADALPDVEMTGTVEKINDVFEVKRGDVTYTALILIDNIDPRLRWGMTVVITFEE